MIAKFRGHSLKIQPRQPFDLNGLKNSTPKYFDNSIKSMQIFQILMGGMNFKEKSQKKPNALSIPEVRTHGRHRRQNMQDPIKNSITGAQKVLKNPCLS